MLKQLTIAALGLAVSSAAALSGDTADDGKGRFQMTPAEGGFLRLDKDTGSVALCARKGEHWACEPVEDRSKGVEDKVAKLEAENLALKDRVKSLEDSLATGTPPKAGETPPPTKMQIPTEEEVDKALDYVERIFKKFRDRLQKLEKPATPKPEGQGGSL